MFDNWRDTLKVEPKRRSTLQDANLLPTTISGEEDYDVTALYVTKAPPTTP